MLASSGQQSQSTGSVDVASIFLPTPRSGLPPYNTRITGSQWTLIISDDNENLAKAVLLQGRRNLMTTLVSLHSLKETGMKSSTGDGAQSSQATAESARIQTLLHAGDDVLKKLKQAQPDFQSKGFFPNPEGRYQTVGSSSHRMFERAKEHQIPAETIAECGEVLKYAGRSLAPSRNDVSQEAYRVMSEAPDFATDGVPHFKSPQEMRTALYDAYRCLAEAYSLATGRSMYTEPPVTIEDWWASRRATWPLITNIEVAYQSDRDSNTPSVRTLRPPSVPRNFSRKPEYGNQTE